MNPQYETLAKCLLPEHMLEWFELTNVELKPKEKKSTRDKQPDDIPVNVIHLYLDENELTPDPGQDFSRLSYSWAGGAPACKASPLA